MIEAELPDGTVLEFPEGTSDAVVDSVVRKHMGFGGDPTPEAIGEPLQPQEDGTAATAPATPPAPLQEPTALPAEPTLSDELYANLKDREKKTMSAVEKYRAGEITYPELFIQGMGQTAALGLESIGDVVTAAIPDWIKEGAQAGFDAFAQTEVGQEGLKKLEEGVEAYSEWALENERAARNLEAVVNLGMVAAPVGGKAAKGGQGVLGRMGTKMKAKGVTKRDHDVLWSFEDPMSVDMLKRQVDGTVKINTREGKAIDALNVTKGFDVDNSSLKNMNNVNKKLNELRTRADKVLQNSTARIDEQNPINAFSTAKQNAIAKSLEPDLTTKAYDQVEGIMAKAMANASHGGRIDSKGLWQARKELDDWLTTKQGEQAFNKKGDVVKAVYDARDAMNTELKAKNRQLGGLLDQQSGLLYASDGLASKASAESAKTIGKVIQGLEKVGFKARATSVLLSGLAGGGGAAAVSLGALTNPAAIAGIIAGGIVAGNIAHYGKKLVSPVLNRQKVGELLTLLDSGIKKAKAADKNDIVKELRLTRAALVSMAVDNGAFEEPEE